MVAPDEIQTPFIEEVIISNNDGALLQTLLETSNVTVQLTETNAQVIGMFQHTTVYVSGTRGLNFTASLKNVLYYQPRSQMNPNLMGDVAVYPVASLNGSYIANVVDQGPFRRQYTVITYDKGAFWYTLQPPAGSPADSWLRLSLKPAAASTSIPGPLTSEQAAGLIVANAFVASPTGNEDGWLRSTDVQPYVSLDAGRSWNVVPGLSKRAYLYDILDHGNVIVFTPRTSTGSIMYTLNGGKSVEEYSMLQSQSDAATPAGTYILYGSSPAYSTNTSNQITCGAASQPNTFICTSPSGWTATLSTVSGCTWTQTNPPTTQPDECTFFESSRANPYARIQVDCSSGSSPAVCGGTAGTAAQLQATKPGQPLLVSGVVTRPGGATTQLFTYWYSRRQQTYAFSLPTSSPLATPSWSHHTRRSPSGVLRKVLIDRCNGMHRFVRHRLHVFSHPIILPFLQVVWNAHRFQFDSPKALHEQRLCAVAPRSARFLREQGVYLGSQNYLLQESGLCRTRPVTPLSERPEVSGENEFKDLRLQYF